MSNFNEQFEGSALPDETEAEHAFINEVLHGLASSPKRIAPKFFYNERGSQLFERITTLPEYYLTRAEQEILERYQTEIAAEVTDTECLIEYGSGSSKKVRYLLDAMQVRTYIPVDISEEQLAASAREIARIYPNLVVEPLSADYTQEFSLPKHLLDETCTTFFPGSTIGNFERDQAIGFLKTMGKVMGGRGAIILGIDKRKDANVLNAAYNDSAGVTAEFNLNILQHLNELLHGDFDLTQFSHVARYNDVAGRIEMYLRSNTHQKVRLLGSTIEFEKNELIHTENSYKYSTEELHKMALAAGMECKRIWGDHSGFFMVAVLKVG